ncbi:MAG: hypothetical protein ACE5FS_09660 [Paracoccaceae bacterium]
MTLGLVAALAAPGLAAAGCYADYKAKKDNPLRLHYGVVQLSDKACANHRAAERAVARRLGAGGWKLLTVISIFGPEGLKQREDSAGQYFLRF